MKHIQNNRVLFSCTALLAVLLLGLLSCASPAPSPKPVAEGTVWLELNLALCSPDDLTGAQKQAFQNYAAAVPAFMIGVKYRSAGMQLDTLGENHFSLRGTLIRQITQLDGLAIWQVAGEVSVPAADRQVNVIKTITIEAATKDADLALADGSRYPANHLVVILANRAIREAAKAGHGEGSIRLVSLQFDKATARFKAKFEIF